MRQKRKPWRKVRIRENEGREEMRERQKKKEN